MTTIVPDLEHLAKGSLKLLGESNLDYCAVRIQFVRHGLKLADESTWREWRRFRWMELWQAVALQLHLDPNTVAWHALGVRHLPRLSISQLYGERMRVAVQHAVHESLPTLKIEEQLRRTTVRPWEFATWCDEIGLPCPAEFPREDPSPKAVDKRSAPRVSSDFLRQADMLPTMLPFSAPTLWRKVKNGSFPAPVKLSAGVTAWRRSEVEDWIRSHRNSGRKPPARGKT